MKEGKLKKLFSRYNIIFIFVPSLVLVAGCSALIVLDVLSVYNKTAVYFLQALVLTALVWMMVGLFILPLRGKSRKKQVIGVFLFILILAVIACCIWLNIWMADLNGEIERLKALEGSAEWTSDLQKELSETETLLRSVRSWYNPSLFVIYVVLLVSGCILKSLKRNKEKDPMELKDIDPKYYLQ